MINFQFGLNVSFEGVEDYLQAVVIGLSNSLASVVEVYGKRIKGGFGDEFICNGIDNGVLGRFMFIRNIMIFILYYLRLFQRFE